MPEMVCMHEGNSSEPLLKGNVDLLARGLQQSLLAAVLCDRPPNSANHTAVDWPQFLGYLTVQESLGTHMSGAGLAIIWEDSAVWPITPILQQGAWCLGQRCCTRFV